MLSVSRPVESAPFPPGNRHGVPSGLFHERQLSLYPSRQRVEQVVRHGGYPSPPMSGTPPFQPSRAAHDLCSSGSSPLHGVSSDALRAGWSSEQQRESVSNRPRSLLPPSNTYPQDTSRGVDIRRSSGHRLPPLLTYNSPESIGSLHGASRMPYDSAASLITPQHSTSQPHSSVPDSSVRALSPRSQRKTKGHVASACVPCKKAHLRCDAQRPCARCVSHGKEDTCVDVRHKKRGRPRLRDDRESRMDATHFGRPQDGNGGKGPSIRPASMGRLPRYDSPSSTPRSAPGSAFPSPEAPGAQYLSRVVSADSSFRGDGQSRMPAEAPVLYMRTNMEIVKASSSFSEAVGTSTFVGRSIMEIVAPETSETMMELCTAMNAEQKRREPTYLPPIFDKGNEAARALSFAPEFVNRLEFNHRAYATFRAYDGQPRSYPIRFCLLKEGSFFFIAALLTGQSRPHYQHSIPHSHTARHTLPHASSIYGAPVPIDSARRQFGESSSVLRREVGISRQSTPQGNSPHSTYQSIYSPSPRGGEPSRPTLLQIPRSELGTSTRTRLSDSQYTLPPIRSFAERARHTPEKDDKHGRLSIGGLINNTGT